GGHRFTPTFDLVFSRFGLMFFDDPDAGFANVRGALAPTGRIVFVCWRAPAENAWATEPLAVAGELIPPLPPSDRAAPGPFSLADRDHLSGLLARAGFADVSIVPHDDMVHLGQTAEAAAVQSLSFGPVSRASADLAPAVKEAIRARLASAYASRL